MTQTIDPHFWQEQEQRANEIRPILERTFAIAYQYGWLTPTEEGCWQYQGEEHTLLYDPDSDALWIEANDGQWRINFHEQAFIPEPDTLITDAQLKDFQELDGYLSLHSVETTVDLQAIYAEAQEQWQQAHNLSEFDRVEVVDGVERLFEFYQGQGEISFPSDLAPQTYQVLVEGKTFLFGCTEQGDFCLQAEGKRIDLSSGEGLTQTDIKTWSDIHSWVNQQQQIPSSPDGQQTLWKQQEDRASLLLEIAQQIFAVEESRHQLQFDGQTYMTRPVAEEYKIGYTPHTDTFWIERGEQMLVAVTECHQSGLSDENRWSWSGLRDLDFITQQDLSRWEGLKTWLEIRDQDFGKALSTLMQSNATATETEPTSLQKAIEELRKDIESSISCNNQNDIEHN